MAFAVDRAGGCVKLKSLMKLFVPLALVGATVFLSGCAGTNPPGFVRYITMTEMNRQSLADQDLGETRFYRARMNGTSFKGTNLKGTTFAQTDLAQADFRGAIMDDTTTFTQVNMNRANLAGLDLQGADFDSVNLRAADLRHTKNWHNLNRSNFTEADVRGADFSAVKVTPAGTVWKDAIYDGKTIFPAGVDPVTAGAIKR
jgi:uncharacterized protein YjbI with pentapeptide repeats